jgi:hypothetical protein
MTANPPFCASLSLDNFPQSFASQKEATGAGLVEVYDLQSLAGDGTVSSFIEGLSAGMSVFKRGM